jgi:SAM-dependent methyltransferase
VSSDDGYLLANQQSGATRRLAALSALFDESTFRHLRALGLSSGWRVWEVGAGGPGVPEWLAEQVGGDGEVLATDLDPAWVSASVARPNLVVRRHDVGTDPRPDGPFDLVHARLVLEHLAERDAVLAKLAGALASGGVLIVEDYDWSPFGFDPADEIDVRSVEAILAFMTQAGYARDYGRRLTSSLAALGLEARGEGRQLAIDGAHPGFAFFRLSFEQLAPHAIDAGLLDAGVAEIARERLADPARRVLTPTLFAGIGRRRG